MFSSRGPSDSNDSSERSVSFTPIATDHTRVNGRTLASCLNQRSNSLSRFGDSVQQGQDVTVRVPYVPSSRIPTSISIDGPIDVTVKFEGGRQCEYIVEAESDQAFYLVPIDSSYNSPPRFLYVAPDFILPIDWFVNLIEHKQRVPRYVTPAQYF